MARPAIALRSLVEESEAAQEENWMISYIDVFVLMTTLFVLLVFLQRPEVGNPETAASSHQTEKVEAGETLDSTLSEDELFNALNSLPATNAGTPDSVTHLEHAMEALSLNEVLANSIADKGLDHLVELKQSPEKTELEIQSRVLFHSGDAELTRPGIDVLEHLLPALRQSSGIIYIEGHTDDQPIETVRYPSNWALAAARATEVLEFFVLEGLDKKRFRAVSFGDTQPLVPNTSDANRRKNRRVNLVIETDSDMLALETASVVR